MSAGERGDFSQIPILDVSTLYGDDEAAIRATAATLRGYLETIGFLYVVGHSIPACRCRSVREAGKRFFDLPEEQKLALKIDKNFRGYLPFAGSTIVTSSVATVSKPNQSESIFFMHEVDADDPKALAEKPLAGPQPVAGRGGASGLPRNDRTLCRRDEHACQENGRCDRSLAGPAAR